MSLRARIVLAILALVLLTAGLSWVAVQRLVLRPFANDVHSSYLRQVEFIGRQLEAGADPDVLAADLGVRIRPFERPIPRRWARERRRGQRFAIAGGPRNLVVISTARGPIAVTRDLDLERPGRRLPWLLLVVAGVIVLFSVLIARRSVQPLQTATRAMTRMAGGDLDHRLEERGPAELVAASRAFNGLADRVKHLLATERQLLAGISHELRTPLTRLRLETELLRDAGVEGRRLDRIDGDLAQLDDLIGEALELSRLQLGTSPLHREPTDLLALARTLEAVDVTVSGDACERPVDRFLVGRLLQNLVGNARKYAPGSMVEVQVVPTGFIVRDHGPGVPEAELAQLFEPFYRTRGGSRRAEGHGLGLMLVRTIATLHGGEVKAENAEPGLRVTVSLADGR